MSSNVIDLQDIKDSLAPKFGVAAMCLACGAKWVESVLVTTSLFHLQCPSCSIQNSYASVLPENYLQALLAETIE